MIDPMVLKELLKKTEPTTLQKVERLLATAPSVAIQYVLYLKARQEQAEMKGELARLQHCVQAMESQLEHLGPTAAGQGVAAHNFTNWMVSFAESYYGLAHAVGASQTMLPRVLSYLQGQHQQGGLAALWLKSQNHLPAPSGLGALAAAVGGLPPFMSK